MECGGRRLKRVREKLGLTYRDVAQLSQEIARRRGNAEFSVPLSRLADIENKETLPSLYRLYSLCAVYRLDFGEVAAWYGVPVQELAGDAFRIQLRETHPVRLCPESVPSDAPETESAAETAGTSLLRSLSPKQKLLLGLGSGLESRHHRYGLIGSEDWSMYPILKPGALIVIDEKRRKIARSGWSDEMDRPIYFLEHRQGYLCGWCSFLGQRLLVQPHPASPAEPRIFAYPDEIEVVGQIVRVSASLDGRRPRLS